MDEGNVLKVVHFITDLDTGGAEMMLYKLLAVWQLESSISSTVVTLMKRGSITDRIESLGVKVYSLGMVQGGWPTLGMLLELNRIIRTVRPDLIQGWMYHGNIAATVATLFLRLSLHSVRLVWNIRQTLYDIGYEKRLTRLLIDLNRLCSRLPSKVIYNSTLSAEQHEGIGFSIKRREVIPNGFDLQRFRPDGSATVTLKRQLGMPMDTLLVGHISRFHPMKGHTTLLQAARLVVDDLGEQNRVRFLLIGRGVTKQQDELVRLIDELELSPYVSLMGERSDVERIMAAVDLVVSPSSWGEGFPNVVGEAMACGTPCVVTDVGDSATVVDNTGRVINAKDYNAMAREIEMMLLNQEKRIELGDQARRRVEEHYSIDAIATRYQNFYQLLCQL